MSDEEKQEGREPELRKITAEEFKRILEEHKKYVESEGKLGSRASFMNANLSRARVSNLDLRLAVIPGINCSDSSLWDAKFNGADLRGANFARALLSKINMDGCSLGKANFSRARLDEASFVNAALGSANFSDARLFKADMTNCRMIKTSLENAQMVKAKLSPCKIDASNLRRVDLSYSILDGAIIKDSDLSKARLWRTSFEDAEISNVKVGDADLRNADFSRARIYGGFCLGGLDLTGTRLPEDMTTWDGLAHVAEGARRAAKLFTTFLLGCLLSVLVTLFGWFLEGPDSFAGANNYVFLPLAKEAKIPLEGFFWAMPLMLMALFFYFQIYMQRLWEPLALLPAIFPDGTPLDKKATPWLPLGYLRAHVRLVRKKDDSPLEFDKGLLTRLQNLAIAALLWGLAPATLAAFWWGYFSFPDKSILGLAWQAGLTWVAVAIALYFQALCRDTLRREPQSDPNAIRWRRFKAYASRHAFRLAWLFVALEYLVCLSILNWPA